MRLSDIKIFEANTPKFKDVWENQIIPRCSQTFKMYQNNLRNMNDIDDLIHGVFMYRGMQRDRGPFFAAETPTGRRPTDSPELVHNQLSKIMEWAGFKARRDNSIFATSNLGTANGYGMYKYVIFPVDGFHYTWSHNFKDLAELTLSARDLNLVAFGDFGKIYKASNTLYKKFYQLKMILIPEKFGGRTGPGHYSMHSDMELILDALLKWCDYFRYAYKSTERLYREKAFKDIKHDILDAQEIFSRMKDGSNKKAAVKYLSEFVRLSNHYEKTVNAYYGREKTPELSEVRMRKILAQINFTNEDLDVAIAHAHEIMIQGVYYAVSTEFIFLERANVYSVPTEAQAAVQKNLKELFRL